MEAGLIEEEMYQEVYILKHESIEIDGVKIFGSPYTQHSLIGRTTQRKKSWLSYGKISQMTLIY